MILISILLYRATCASASDHEENEIREFLDSEFLNNLFVKMDACVEKEGCYAAEWRSRRTLCWKTAHDLYWQMNYGTCYPKKMSLDCTKHGSCQDFE